MVIPDNLKSGVTKASRYEPILSRTYAEMLAHYDTAALPARPYKPKDKAKVEVGVQIIERWVLAKLHKMTFFSLYDLNKEIKALIAQVNNKPFKKLPGSRREHFENTEGPALKPLPLSSFEYAEWRKATVHIDYHLEIYGHYYSVPYTLIKRRIDVRITANTIGVF